jgi:hypothetical protein
MLAGLMGANKKEYMVGQQYFAWAKSSAKPDGPAPRAIERQVR